MFAISLSVGVAVLAVATQASRLESILNRAVRRLGPNRSLLLTRFYAGVMCFLLLAGLLRALGLTYNPLMAAAIGFACGLAGLAAFAAVPSDLHLQRGAQGPTQSRDGSDGT